MDELKLDYEAVELAPTATEIELKSNRKDIFVYGSVRLARLAQVHSDWIPGSFYGKNHRFEKHAPHYQNHLLNYETTVFKLSDQLNWKPGEEKFIKPYRDAKAFTGKVFTQLKWDNFVSNALQESARGLLNSETLVQASMPQHLIKEARLWIVGETVVAGVYYKFHGDQPFEATVSEEGIQFAKQMINLYCVAEAFVMDIGFTGREWKIVEINCINSAGLYHQNPRPLFRALELYFNK
ncbi:MAG: ATP-grasp domain-containing protein [Bacteroidota bacterium]